jgi:hypothetical protein
MHTHYPGINQAKVLTKLTESYISKRERERERERERKREREKEKRNKIFTHSHINFVIQTHYCTKKRKKGE